jgi:hypothetical protein
VKEYNTVVSSIEKDQDVLLLVVKGGVAQYLTIPATGGK